MVTGRAGYVSATAAAPASGAMQASSHLAQASLNPRLI
ncbi:Uncharacterised protein [Bordetella pertussis]|nr:Uncharacterised protein [Bordetella pertussis]